MFSSNEALTLNSGAHRQPNAAMVGPSNPSRNITAGATDGSEVTLVEITTPILLPRPAVGALMKSELNASGSSGSITVTVKVYIDDVEVRSTTHSAVGFGATNEITLYPIANAFEVELYCPKFKITSQVTANTLDSGTTTHELGNSSNEQLYYIPVVGG